MPEAGVVIVWIVVVGFTVILGMALLALANIIPMEPKYMRVLAPFLFVDLVGAGFYLFYNVVQPPSAQFRPNLVTDSSHLFDNTGRLLPRTYLTLGDDTVQTFNSQPVAFDMERGFEVSGSALLIRGQPGNYLLGTIDIDDLARVENSLLTTRTHLNLGLHYADCMDGTSCQQRRDTNQAITHLLSALAVENAPDVHEQAVVQLFHLKENIQTCSAFGRLAEELERHRPVPYRYLELGDIYLAIALYVDEIDPEDRTAARRLALKNLLRYLSLPQVAVGTDLFNRAIVQASQLVKILTFGRNHPVSSALQSVDRQQFSLASESIAETPVMCLTAG